MVLAVQAHRGLFGLLRLHSRAEDVALADELLELVDLRASADVRPSCCRTAQQRQLEIAVALGGRPRLLLLDEPSSGMSAHERAGLGDVLKRVVNTATVVMAEHDVHVVRTVATRVTAFAEGKKIAEGSADDVFDSPDVRTRLPARPTGRDLLDVETCTRSTARATSSRASRSRSTRARRSRWWGATASAKPAR